jgi:tetratricopeptide (TPR) repeat protein
VEVFDLTYNPDGSITQKVKVTETVTITDEDGKKVQAEAAKKEFIKKIAIFPFDYNGEDKTYDYLKYGFPFGCCVSLLQDPLVEIEFPNDNELDGWIFNYKLTKAGYEKGENVPLPLKKKIAKELHCNYFVSGNINVVENKIQIISKVYETKNGKQINENKIENTNLFQLIDNYSIQIRKDIGISNAHIEQNENLSIADITTESLDAYKNYINGIVTLLYQNDYNTSFKLLQSATKDDPTFVLGNYSLFWCSLISNNEEYQKESDNAMTKAINHIYKLPPRLSYAVKVIYYLIHKGDEDKAQKVVKMWIKQFPESLAPLNRLARLYQRNNRRSEAINTYEKIKQKDPDYINTYYALQECYLAQEDYENALKNAEIYMKHCPTDAASYIAIGDINYKKGDYEEAKDFYEQALMLESNSSDCMRKIANTEYAVGNITEAEEQLMDALTFCKSNQDYYIIFDAQSTLFENCGRIKESIICN